jgi:hypothetical protein
MEKSIKKIFGTAFIVQIIVVLSGCTFTLQSPEITPTSITPATSVCHSTDDPTNPYELMNVTPVELDVHIGHASDIIPAPVGGCPTSPVVINDGKIIVCHATGSKTNPYEEITISLNGLNGHGLHEGDIFPSEKGGCPTTPVVNATGDAKISICHATKSETNPYNEITVSINGLNGHDKHAGDIIPAPGGGCPEKSK